MKRAKRLKAAAYTVFLVLIPSMYYLLGVVDHVVELHAQL